MNKLRENRELMFRVLDELGIECSRCEGDINLQEYIIDSFGFINFIVCVEEIFNIEIPDEYLSFETIQSMNGFIELIEQCR